MSGWNKTVLVVVGLAILGLIEGYISFALSLPKPVLRPAVETDAIVVWTGGRDRINTALTLLDQDLADEVFLSGVDPSVTLDDILAVSEPVDEDLTARISFEQRSLNTQENANETADWARAQELRSLRLVTSAYHMPRSLALLRRRLPMVEIIPHPVAPEELELSKWWQPGTISIIAPEFVKFMTTVTRHWAVDAIGLER